MSSNIYTAFYFPFITIKVTALLHYIASALAIRKEAKSACALLFFKSSIKPGEGDWGGKWVLFVMMCMTSW